jgi:hypothetical protein
VRIRRAARLLSALALLVGCASPTPRPARFLYVWAGTGHPPDQRGTDFIAVLDADSASASYGQVIGATTVAEGGLMPHHSEFVLPRGLPFFANDFTTGRSFLIDPREPASPRLVDTIDSVPGYRQPHSFARLADTLVLATLQFGDPSVAGSPGGLAEFTAEGRLLRTASSRDSSFPGARIRTYGITLLPAIDRALTTSSPMDSERTAHVVQVWRLSDLNLLKTVLVPGIPGDSVEHYPFEVRTLSDGRTVFLNTYNCGFYRITDLDQAEPRIELVLSMREPRRIGCSVPVLAGDFWVMPIAYSHQLVTLDLSDPAHPKEVSQLLTDSTFFPHWLSPDPGSDRLIVTEQGDGPPRLLMARLDRASGQLSWDARFRDDSSRPGISFDRARWPNGLHGMAMPHAALFVP